MLRVLPGVRKGVETHIQVSGLRFQCSLHLTIHPLRFRSSLSLRCKLAIVFFFFNAIVLFISEPWFLHNGEKQSWTMFLPKAGSGIIGEPCGNGRTFQCGIYLPLPPSPDPRLLNPAPCPLAWPLSGTVTPTPLSTSPPLGYPPLCPMSQQCCRHVASVFRHVSGMAISTWLPVPHRSGGEWPRPPLRRV